MGETIPTTDNAEGREKRIEAAITSKLDAIAKRHEDKVLEGIADIIAKHEGAVDRSGLPESYANASQHRGTIETRSPSLPLYRNLPEEVRRYRNPDSDHWIREFLAGVVQNDGAQRMLAQSKLDAAFPDLSRADTLEGAADAAGGFPGGTGGVLLPRVLEQLVAIARDRIAKMARFATTYQMTTQEHNIPTGAAMSAFMVGEATSPTTTGEPALAQVPLIAHKGAAKAIVGNDLLEDSAVNVVNFFVMRAGGALGVLEDNEFFKLGTGSAPHVTKLSGTAYSETTSGTLSYGDVVGMYQAQPQVYLPGSRWFVSSDVLGKMANVRDGQGRPFYQSLLDAPVGLGDGATGGASMAQGTLLGHPVHQVPFTNGDIWFGDPSAVYAVGRRTGIRAEISREFYFDTFRTILLVSQRFAGNNVDTAGAQYATGITTATSL